jgi:hypothetical protein
VESAAARVLGSRIGQFSAGFAQGFAKGIAPPGQGAQVPAMNIPGPFNWGRNAGMVSGAATKWTIQHWDQIQHVFK